MATLNTESDSSSALSDSKPPTAKEISVPDSQGERGEPELHQPTLTPTGESAPEAPSADSPTLAGLMPNSEKRAGKAAAGAAGSARQLASAKAARGTARPVKRSGSNSKEPTAREPAISFLAAECARLYHVVFDDSDEGKERLDRMLT